MTEDDRFAVISVMRQAYALNTWYNASRMNLHRMFPFLFPIPKLILAFIGGYLTQITVPGPSAQKPTPNIAGLKKSHEQCISLAIDLLRLQISAHDAGYSPDCRRQNAAWMGNNWAFELCFFLFDGAVTLMSGFSRMPVEARAKEAKDLVKRTVEILEGVGIEGGGPGGKGKRDIAWRAVDVLNVLGRELGWRKDGAAQQAASTTHSVPPLASLYPSPNFAPDFSAHPATTPYAWAWSPPVPTNPNTYEFASQVPSGPMPMDTSSSLSMFLSGQPEANPFFGTTSTGTGMDMGHSAFWQEMAASSTAQSEHGSSNDGGWTFLE